eukprot:3055409-Pyramimonas_sp.AAC.1
MRLQEGPKTVQRGSKMPQRGPSQGARHCYAACCYTARCYTSLTRATRLGIFSGWAGGDTRSVKNPTSPLGVGGLERFLFQLPNQPPLPTLSPG